MTAARLQRWAPTLVVYKYAIMYKSGSQNQNAVSRLPEETAQPGEEAEERGGLGIYPSEIFDAGPVSRKQLEDLACKDPVMQVLR